MEIRVDNLTGESTGPVHWMNVWKSALDDHGIIAIEGRLESHGGRNGPVHWRIRTVP